MQSCDFVGYLISCVCARARVCVCVRVRVCVCVCVCVRIKLTAHVYMWAQLCNFTRHVLYEVKHKVMCDVHMCMCRGFNYVGGVCTTHPFTYILPKGYQPACLPADLHPLPTCFLPPIGVPLLLTSRGTQKCKIFIHITVMVYSAPESLPTVVE